MRASCVVFRSPRSPAGPRSAAKQLEALEAEQYERLPGGVFVRGYVRAVAPVVGLNPDEVAAALRSDVEPPSDSRSFHTALFDFMPGPPRLHLADETDDRDRPLPRSDDGRAPRDLGRCCRGASVVGTRTIASFRGRSSHRGIRTRPVATGVDACRHVGPVAALRRKCPLARVPVVRRARRRTSIPHQTPWHRASRCRRVPVVRRGFHRSAGPGPHAE